MKKEYLEAGKVVGTHGIKGEIRVLPWSDGSDFLLGFKRVFLSDKTELSLVSAKPHGNITLVKIKGVDTIEDAEKLRGKTLLVSRDDCDIEEGRYFVSELISCTVFDADSGEKLGSICDVSETGANDVWHIKSGEKEFLIPVIDDVVLSVDIEKGEIFIRPLGGIFDEN